MTTLQQPQHPVLEAVVAVTSALDQVAEANPAFMATDQKATTLVEIARAKAQLAELELRVLATADDVAAESAARDVAAWLHHHTHQRPEVLRADLRLASALDRSYGLVAAAMRVGECNPAQAQVITQALDELPADLDPEIKTKAEETLLAYATQFDPAQLRRLGRRILEVIAPEIAEAEEAKRLAAEEAHARKKTRLSMRRLGTAPPGSRPWSPMRPRTGSPPTWRRSPHPGARTAPAPTPATTCPTTAASARRSASCSKPSTQPGCPSTAETPPR
ncbi:DUF222 domain-containing protein [Nocardioides sp. KC13]|uniref:DUF222 domain-containing protein n=1 Tax=Nocardioides turkmenicus TaxID=2711220 RepID=A0A6M1R444_9ACTN|nr:DUF222 domain-containing protein [Nocardioides sp. KC13]